MPFTPQSIHWPGTRAVLLVHGIGDASTGKAGAFPLDEVKAALGGGAAETASYTLNYDFINDWMKTKVRFEAGIVALKARLATELGGSQADAVIAEYAGDVLWPVLSTDIRLAIRDAFVAQLEQIHVDRGEAALGRGADPLDYKITIIAHSLGCFHTYEVLHAIAREPAYALRPASDLFTLDSVILMASPVQLIRTVAGWINALVPDPASLATLAPELSIPAEQRRGRSTPCTSDFYSITGTHDPVGGHLLGKRLDWAYMDIPGQHAIIVSQTALQLDTRDGTAIALAKAFASGRPRVNDPHSWTAYVESQSRVISGLVLT